MSTSSSVPDNICANCGKGEESSEDLKSCTACKLVRYCNRDCQIAHRTQHKKLCKKRAAELHEEALFKQPPNNEDCPICFLPLPLHVNQKVYMACCGKELCLACVDEADQRHKHNRAPCVFCRTPAPSTEPIEMSRITKRMNEKNDGKAYNFMGTGYLYGQYGLPTDAIKAKDLFLKGGQLGSSDGYCNVGNLYSDGNVLGRGIEQDKKKAKYYYELSSIMGNVDARYSVAGMELNTLGNTRRGYKHYLIAAKSGYELALRHVKEGYTKGHVTKDEFEDALRSYKKSADEMKSDARDEAAETVPSTTSPDCTIS